ncbi:MAG: ferrochelatase [Alphaproteobacteria bacterium]|nr:ferrochelatase [Alphaproteobacteria bacterium]
MDQNKKIAVILFNLGGPDSRESIKPFLFNFFMDKNIIRAPIFIRYFLAKLISIRRSKREAGNSYAELGDKSPLLENSLEQAQALEKLLNAQGEDVFKTFVSMRYWHPMADAVMLDVQEFNPDEIILLPLYPQFSTTTARSSFQQWDKACTKFNYHKPTTTICCYPWDEGFVEASAENIKQIYREAQKKTDRPLRLLLSAHGLPEKIIQDGDPYQWQCEQSAEKIAKATGIDNLDWQICYQSRVGPLKWIGPSTEEALQKAATDKVGVMILPHAFTQEHVETLVEIEIEYRELAEKMGVHDFYRVPTVGTSAAFIDGLSDLILRHRGKGRIVSQEGQPLCPSHFKECCMRTQRQADRK